MFAPTDQAFADANIDLAGLDTPDGVSLLSEILSPTSFRGLFSQPTCRTARPFKTANDFTMAFSIGDKTKVNGATITQTDAMASNGVIHVIDTVLSSPTVTPNDLPRTAQCTGKHASLVAALVQAELVETLQGDGPFTVFAPTDQAFADANIDLSNYDTPEGKDALADLLQYHVVPGTVLAADVENYCMTATAVNGQIAVVQRVGHRHGEQRRRDRHRCDGQQRRHPRHRHGAYTNRHAKQHRNDRWMHERPHLAACGIGASRVGRNAWRRGVLHRLCSDR